MAKNVSSNPQDHVHVRQRGNKWSYRFAKAKLDGKRQTEERGGFNTKDEALVAGVKAYELYMSGGRATQPTELSFGDFLDIWYERTKLYARNNTLEMREKNIRLHIKPALGEYRLASLRPALIDQFVKEKRKAGYSYETVCRMLGNINT
ncbi:N-terminal phage integrase SAM-like domain-containing protein, partial [Mitsuokella sp.]|uniref:N-terminal phage integrase SAM-like domain-containing protein n=1 Tax=Mitsuokella sp. TaxID=2049034 RepID=UPI003D7CCFEC